MHFKAACTQVKGLLLAIKTAAAKSSRGAERATPVKKDAFYHPLYSSNQYHLIPMLVPVVVYASPVMTPDGGLLPLPTSPDTSPCTPRAMTDEECRSLIKSPYLSFARKQISKSAGASLFAHARDRIAPSTPLMDPEEPSPPPNRLEAEIAQYLPGKVPGIRQSKEYKKIRRKITEIDDLIDCGNLDFCQRKKVEKRPQYVQMIIDLLVHGAIQETCQVAGRVENPQDIETPIEVDLESTEGSQPLDVEENHHNHQAQEVSPNEDVSPTTDQLELFALDDDSLFVPRDCEHDYPADPAPQDPHDDITFFPTSDNVCHPISCTNLQRSRIESFLGHVGDWVCDCLGEFFVGRDSYYP